MTKPIKPRLTAREMSEIAHFANWRMIPQISDFINDIAMDVAARTYPDIWPVPDNADDEEIVLDCEDTVAAVITAMILETIKREI